MKRRILLICIVFLVGVLMIIWWPSLVSLKDQIFNTSSSNKDGNYQSSEENDSTNDYSEEDLIEEEIVNPEESDTDNETGKTLEVKKPAKGNPKATSKEDDPIPGSSGIKPDPNPEQSSGTDSDGTSGSTGSTSSGSNSGSSTESSDSGSDYSAISLETSSGENITVKQNDTDLVLEGSMKRKTPITEAKSGHYVRLKIVAGKKYETSVLENMSVELLYGKTYTQATHKLIQNFGKDEKPYFYLNQEFMTGKTIPIKVNWGDGKVITYNITFDINVTD